VKQLAYFDEKVGSGNNLGTIVDHLDLVEALTRVGLNVLFQLE
jgi:hypothetical protein